MMKPKVYDAITEFDYLIYILLREQKHPLFEGALIENYTTKDGKTGKNIQYTRLTIQRKDENK